MSNFRNVKGFRDYLPTEAKKRQLVVQKIIGVFEKFGFEPLETPTLEYLATLEGKYGEEEKLIYKFDTPGGDKVALKYDQTVPLARIIAQYGPKGEQQIALPFKRYQIQNAFRGENTQKGRYREFLQCDIDIVGVDSALADAEVLTVVANIYKTLGLEVVVKINDRELLSNYDNKILSAIDKLNKIGESGVIEHLEKLGQSNQEAREILGKITNMSPSPRLEQVLNILKNLGYQQGDFEFDPVMVRGLDYYTGLIVEVVLKDSPTAGALGGGGRWDQLIGKFIGLELPAVGFSVGLDRTIEAMDEKGLFDQSFGATILVSVFAKEFEQKSMEIVDRLRKSGISSEIWLGNEGLEKQLKYADQKKMKYVVILGPDEASSDQVKLKNLENGESEMLSLDELISKLSP